MTAKWDCGCKSWGAAAVTAIDADTERIRHAVLRVIDAGSPPRQRIEATQVAGEVIRNTGRLLGGFSVESIRRTGVRDKTEGRCV